MAVDSCLPPSSLNLRCDMRKNANTDLHFFCLLLHTFSYLYSVFTLKVESTAGSDRTEKVTFSL